MKNNGFAFAAAGTVMTILFLAIVNMLTSPGTNWFVYPAFGILWWPVSILFLSRGQHKAFSVAGCVMILVFLSAVNLMFSPGVPWVLLTIFPVLWWPVTILFGRRAGTTGFAIVSCLLAMLYYGFLNLAYFPGHPWMIYVAYALFWWPMTLFFVRRHAMRAYSFAGAVITIVFFVAVNLITTPFHIWFVYPVFVVLWWPLSTFFFHTRPRPHAV